jgi:hypothetical protein
MAGVGKNNLCSLAFDGLETETSPPDRAPGNDPASAVKQWLRQNLGPAKLAEFERFMQSMMDDEGEDEEPDIIPSGPRVQAKGAWNINGRRASVEGNPQALDARPSIYDRNGRVGAGRRGGDGVA